jgi:single-stranded DNA-binding protein
MKMKLNSKMVELPNQKVEKRFKKKGNFEDSQNSFFRIEIFRNSVW